MAEPLRVWLVGFGTVGQWVARALEACAVPFSVVGVATAHDGFTYGERRWPTALEGLRATDADVLVEVTSSPSRDGEPGLSHMREALGRGIPVVTSNKWPVALHGVELAELARARGVAFRAESTVMSGTPVLSSLIEGLAGTVPIAVRGLLNATVNFILTAMTQGSSYEEALADAQRAGLAERDPSADVDGDDAVAKVMILSALVFGRQLRRDQVSCRGITDLTRAEFVGARLKHVATLEFSEPGGIGDVTARVTPEPVDPGDPLANIEGPTNAIAFRADPVGEVVIAGPGAGPQLAGQGVFSDLLAVARSRRAT